MSSLKTKENPQYKDRLFRMLFGSIEMRENIISLYNALNNTTYSSDTEFEITTLDDAIYIKMKNDVSLLIDSYLPLWEQQSSYNPNMPIRGLMYFGQLYDAYIKQINANIYGSRLVKIPTPQYIVFYNGLRDLEPVRKLKLSDAFINEDSSQEFEWTATMYNLNKGKNEELLAKCKPLSEYMTFINYIREYQKSESSDKMGAQSAVDKAVVRCIEEGIMEQFLKKHRAEVLGVVITEYDEKTFIKGIREEGKAEGKAEGEIIGEIKALYKRLKLSPNQIADEMNLTLDEVINIIEQL